MLQELDTVALRTDLPEHGLRAGDFGTIVMEHHGDGFEVEFLAIDGATIAVITLKADQIRPIEAEEIT